MTQKELSEQLGVSHTFLSHIELGERNVPDSFLKKISDYFDLPLSYLLLIQLKPNLDPKDPLFNALFNVTDKIINDILNESDNEKCSLADDFNFDLKKSKTTTLIIDRRVSKNIYSTSDKKQGSSKEKSKV